MRLWLGLLLVAALARAGTLEVERAPVDLLHAERVDITSRFEVVRIETAKALVGSTRLDGVEISEVMTPAGTFVSRGHWTYTVTLQERSPDAVGSGIFDLRLALQGAPTRVVRLVQDVANPLLSEGARVTFDLGPTLPAAPLFVLTMTEVPVGPVIELTSAINASFEYVWLNATQVENPVLHGRVGETITFVVTNGDGTGPHNLQIQDGSDPLPSSPDVMNLGDQTTLVWTPQAAGSFRYECRYHPTMSKTIEVTS